MSNHFKNVLVFSGLELILATNAKAMEDKGHDVLNKNVSISILTYTLSEIIYYNFGEKIMTMDWLEKNKELIFAITVQTIVNLGISLTSIKRKFIWSIMDAAFIFISQSIF